MESMDSRLVHHIMPCIRGPGSSVRRYDVAVLAHDLPTRLCALLLVSLIHAHLQVPKFCRSSKTAICHHTCTFPSPTVKPFSVCRVSSLHLMDVPAFPYFKSYALEVTRKNTVRILAYWLSLPGVLSARNYSCPDFFRVIYTVPSKIRACAQCYRLLRRRAVIAHLISTEKYARSLIIISFSFLITVISSHRP